MTEFSTFQRVILGMRHNLPRQGLRHAVDLATLLRIELRGLYFSRQDELGSLAAFPFVREYRPLEGGWHKIQRTEIAEEIDAAARSAERSFREAAKKLNRPSRFEIIRSPMTEAVKSISRAGDILVVSEPADPAEHATSQFQAALEVALESPASVMLVPSGIVRESGPVVAAATTPDDPCIEAAAEIAAFANERLSIVDATSVFPGLRAESTHTGGVDATGQVASVSSIADARAPSQERLIVLTRTSFRGSIAALISSSRRVPILLLGPTSDQGETQ